MVKLVNVYLSKAQQERVARGGRTGKGVVCRISKDNIRSSPNARIRITDSDARKVASSRRAGHGCDVEALPPAFADAKGQSGGLGPVAGAVAAGLLTNALSSAKTRKKAVKTASKVGRKIGKAFGFGMDGGMIPMPGQVVDPRLRMPARPKPILKGKGSCKKQKGGCSTGKGLYIPGQKGNGLFIPGQKPPKSWGKGIPESDVLFF